MQVVTLETAELGDRSYLVHDGSVGVVIDVQRDIDRMEAEIAKAGVTVTHVVETHLHNDYVTGGLALARATGAQYVVAGADSVEFDRREVADGDSWTTGSLTVSVHATPGHTLNHVAYEVSDADTRAVFTGGNLLYGSVGRTDLVDPSLTDELTRKQWRSARLLADRLPGDTLVYPTHGFGSFCSSGPATVKDVSTMAEQRRDNNALTTDDEDTFVKDLVAGLTAYPRYYAHMGPRNAAGPDPMDLESPTALDPAALHERLAAGDWVVDLRDRKAYAAKHVEGTLSFELGQNFTTYLGWVLPYGDPLVLIGDSPEQVEQAQRDLARIGIERGSLHGAATAPVDELAQGRPASYPLADWAELKHAMAAEDWSDSLVLDVRRDDEFEDGHIEGAVNIPIHDLLQRLEDVPTGRRLWVHCGSGYRAAIATSILAREGHDVVHVDSDWGDAAKAGLPVTGS